MRYCAGHYKDLLVRYCNRPEGLRKKPEIGIRTKRGSWSKVPLSPREGLPLEPAIVDRDELNYVEASFYDPTIKRVNQKASNGA